MKLAKSMMAAILGICLFLSFSSAAAAEDMEWSAGDANITSISVSSDSESVAAGSYDAKAFVFQADGRPLFTYETQNVVTGTAYLEDGSLLVSSDDRHLYRIDEQGNVVWDINLRRQVSGVAASDDGSTIVALAKGATAVYVFDKEGSAAGEINIGIQPRKADVSGNGEWIAVGGADQYVYLLNEAREIAGKFSVTGTIDTLAVTNDGRAVAGTSARQVYVFDQSGNAAVEFMAMDSVTAVDASDDGRYFAVADFAGNYYVLDGKGAVLWKKSGTNAGSALRMSPDGKVLYTGSGSGQIQRIEISGAIASAKQKSLIYGAAAIAGGLALTGLAVWLLLYMKRTNRLGLFRSVWRERYSYLMLLPTFALIAVFLYYPAFSGLFHSLYDWNPGARSTFVGLANYERMINDPYVSKGLGNLLLLIVTGLIKTVVPPLLVAEFIYFLRRKSSQYGFRTAFVTSMIIPSVAGLLIWQNFYDPEAGLLNKTLELLGLGGWTHSWLGDPNTAIWAIIFMGFPFIGILSLLIFYAGLISIPQDTIESAKIDGAGTFRIICSLHLPFLSGQMKLLIILSFIGIIQDFGGILIVTGGGPLDSTYVPALQMYFAATRFNDLGYASALGVSMFLVILALTVINMKFIKTSTD